MLCVAVLCVARAPPPAGEQGILLLPDDGDRERDDSENTLSEIAKIFQQNPGVKLSVEGAVSS